MVKSFIIILNLSLFANQFACNGRSKDDKTLDIIKKADTAKLNLYANEIKVPNIKIEIVPLTI